MFNYSNIVEDLVIERLMESNGDHIPVIISGADCECDDLEKYVRDLGGVIKYRLPIINAVAAYIPPISVKSFTQQKNIDKVHFDNVVHKLMNTASVTVASDYANERGLTGKDIGVAVVDTGVHPHSDLTMPNNRITAFKDFIQDKSNPYDDEGHGTHVAGIIAGNGFSSNGKYMGIAPDANIIGVKVLNKEGGGNISDVIAGIQWVIKNKEKYNIKVITLSLGTPAKASYLYDPLCKAVDRATKEDITVVAAAGNSGPKEGTINSPAISPNVIAVGACDDRSASSPKNCKVANFSSRGPTPDGIHKPDILAPGVKINSLSNKGNGYHTLSGTSMAAPIIAGCTALLCEANPSITPVQIKETMTKHSLPLGYEENIGGSGLLDIKKIIEATKPLPESNKKEPANKSLQGLFAFDGWILVALIVLLILVL